MKKVLAEMGTVKDFTKDKTYTFESTGKQWEETANELGITVEKVSKNFDIPLEKAKNMHTQGVGVMKIMEIGLIADKFNKTHDEVFQEYLKGAKKEDVEYMYAKEGGKK